MCMCCRGCSPHCCCCFAHCRLSVYCCVLLPTTAGAPPLMLPPISPLLLLTWPPCLSVAVNSPSVVAAVCSPPNPARSPARSILSKPLSHPQLGRAPAEMPSVSEVACEPSSHELAPRGRESKRQVSSWCPCARSEMSCAEVTSHGTVQLVRARVALAVVVVSRTVPAVASPRSNGVCCLRSLEVLAEVAEDPKYEPKLSLSTIFWQDSPGPVLLSLCCEHCYLLLYCHCLHCKYNIH